GYAADQGRKLGTANFTASLMNESTGKLDSVEVARTRQRLGAITSVGCGLDNCSASLNALNDQLQPSLALFADIVRDPAFKPADIERVRGQWLADIAQEKTQPVGLALRTLPPLLYGAGHAYGIPFTGTGTEASIKALTAADLRTFQHDWLRPDNAKVAAQAKPRVFLIDRPDAPQSLIMAGLLAPSTRAPDNLAIQVANGAFGGTFTSRLNMNLREDKRWAYGAQSFLMDAQGQRPM